MTKTLFFQLIDLQEKIKKVSDSPVYIIKFSLLSDMFPQNFLSRIDLKYYDIKYSRKNADVKIDVYSNIDANYDMIENPINYTHNRFNEEARVLIDQNLEKVHATYYSKIDAVLKEVNIDLDNMLKAKDAYLSNDTLRNVMLKQLHGLVDVVNKSLRKMTVIYKIQAQDTIIKNSNIATTISNVYNSIDRLNNKL